MITLVRIEGEADSLATLATELDAAEKALKLPKSMSVHDEHYERTAPELFKGRRVFRPGLKAGGTLAFTSSGNTATSITSGSGIQLRAT